MIRSHVVTIAVKNVRKIFRKVPIMELSKIDLDYWQQRQVPAWGLKLDHLAIRVSIDQIVNKNSGKKKYSNQLDIDHHNAIGLLRTVRKNLEYDNRNTGVMGSLIDYMERYQQQDGRLKLYRRWVRKWKARQ